jgi:hypothetical protein
MPKPHAAHKAKLQAKYPDPGIPGWDASLLLNKKSDFVQDNLATLQRNVQEKNARLNTLMVDAMAFGADNLAIMMGKGGDEQVLRSDKLRGFLDALALEGRRR